MKKYYIVSLTLLFMTLLSLQMKSQNTDYIQMIEYAIKAPSGHNTQPWLFKINTGSIEIHPNMEKMLPVVDPDNRELFISLGCATENLCIAASKLGYRASVDINKSGIISIDLIKDSTISASPLFEQIPLRQVNRSVYNDKIISKDTLDIIKNIELEDNIKMHLYQKGSSEFDTIKYYVQRGNAIQMNDKAFKDELKSWMRLNKGDQDKTNDGLSYAVFGAPNLPKFIAKPIINGSINAKTQNKGDLKKIDSSSHFILFTSNSSSVIEWVNLGRSLERTLLQLTELNIAQAFCNQPNEIDDLAKQMKKYLNIENEYPSVLLRIGYGDKMPYSRRKSIEEVLINMPL